MATAAAPGLDEVMGFLTAQGYARAASALRDDVVARGGGVVTGDEDDEEQPHLPQLRVPGGGGSGERPASSGSSSGNGGEGGGDASSDTFVSMRSSLSGLLNPYGMWSPPRVNSEASSDMEFGTARDYAGSDFFFSESWLYDDHLFPAKHGSKSTDDDDDDDGEDKFVTSIGIDKNLPKRETRQEHIGNAECEGCTDVYRCSLLSCDCCRGSEKGASSSTVYGRYQVMDDHTEVLDECGVDGFRSKEAEDVVLEGDLLRDVGKDGEEGPELAAMGKELQILSSYAAADVDHNANHEFVHDFSSNGKNLKDMADEKFGEEGYSIQPFPDSGEAEDVEELGDYEPANGGLKDSGTLKAEEDPDTNVDAAFSNFNTEYEVFDLRIIHRKNRTGFEENKDFPIVLNSLIAGRYYVTEYLGSAAFSKVVQAHDLHTGMDLCLKIIKNDKDFFDQSLDEIKLLKFVNKYDPADEHHILRLYDYFYHQEHLFIVTELLRANLYEFQKYNQESGGEVYFTLPRIQAIARQILEALVYLHHLRIIHCDLKPENILIKSYSRCEIKVIDLGSSCFLTDNLSLYVQSRSYRSPEVILGLPYDQKIDVWSLGCILAELYTGDVLFPNESIPMMLARIIGIIGPIDMEMLALGQETRKYFTKNYDLYHTNEETSQMEYLIPDKTSLANHLQCFDSKFLDFLSYLLQINPRRRPTASEALQHRWLSFSYQ